jgi:serralysin
MATIVAGAGLALNLDQLDVGLLFTGTVAVASATHIQILTDGPQSTDFFGNFLFDALGNLAGGTLNEIRDTVAGNLLYDVSGFSVSATAFAHWVATDDNASAKTAILAGDDTATGTQFDDLLRGYGGNDTFIASAGFDTLDGGSGLNTVVFHGGLGDYRLTANANGSWTLQDARAGSPDGTATLISIRTLQFNVGSVAIAAPPSTTNLQQVQTEFSQVMRETVATAMATPTVQLAGGVTVANPAFTAANFVLPIASQIQSGLITQAQAGTMLAALGAATSSVATLSYEFFTGKAPSSGGMDFLVSPTGPNANNLNSAYYQSFSLENRYINFAVNLGKVGEGKTAFTAAYGALSLFEATRTAYAKIFGEAPSDTKLHALLDPTTVLNGQTFTRADYFAYYGGDGANGIGTKAAMVGYLLAEAVKADVGTFALSNDAFLADVALHNAAFGVDLVGQYSQPSFVFHPG